MKIVITFDSWEELESFHKAEAPTPYFTPVEPITSPVTFSGRTLTDVMNADTVEAITVGTPVEPDYELLRLDVRKALADLNKAKDGKPAQQLIKNMGFDKLTNVPGERLQELLDKAKEAMNAD